MQFIEELQWLTPDRLVLSGSFNPAAAEYVVFDANTSRELRSYFVHGSAWAPSPDGSHLAYEHYDYPRFCVDDTCRPDGTGGYPTGKRRLEFHWPPVWSDDSGRVAIQASEIDGSGRKLVVVTHVNGTVYELWMPSEAGEYGVLFWDGRELILGSGSLKWKMNTDRSEFIRMAK